MTEPLKKLTIKGFKSIESLVDFELGALNVLIGANGAGKSNFVDFFRMLRAMADESFQVFVTKCGGADGFFHMGAQHTPKISAELVFGQNAYGFDLSATAKNQMMIDQETTRCNGSEQVRKHGQLESVLRSLNEETSRQAAASPGGGNSIYKAVSNWMVYHVHDTSLLAPMRREQSVRDRDILRHDASNIAPFLLKLREKHEGNYSLIRDTVRMVAPFFEDFRLEPEMKGPAELVRLEWRQKESNYPFQPYQLSDGTIRFICLATALLQPTPPAIIVLDEPELGLHPLAIALLASLIESASERMQVILSTQSPTLLNQFRPEDVIVVNRQAGRSTFTRLDMEMLREWLEEYSVAELWQKNVLQGGPAHE
jgi:predicted ATPase